MNEYTKEDLIISWILAEDLDIVDEALTELELKHTVSLPDRKE